MNIEETILSLRKDKYTYKEIARITNIKEGDIWRTCKKNGLCNENYFSKEGIEARNKSIAKRKTERDKQETYICQYCNETYIRNIKRHGNEGKRFCSRECAFADKARNKKEKRQSCKVYFPVCIICEQVFTSSKNNIKYCSDKCRKKKASTLGAKRYQEIIKKYRIERHKERDNKKICEECDREFITEYGYNGRYKFCCEICAERHSRRILHHKRRARERNIKYENINPYKIFIRDNWTCQLCGRKTPRRLRGSMKRRAPELDHIIPLAVGGEHTRKNVQCACRECNGKKGASAQGQLLLFG